MMKDKLKKVPDIKYQINKAYCKIRKEIKIYSS